jgi:hypothetical protein
MAVDLVASLTRDAALRKANVSNPGEVSGHLSVGLTPLFGHSQRILSQIGVFSEPNKYRRIWRFWSSTTACGLWFPFRPARALERVLAAYLVPATILGMHFAAVFWVNHVGMPLIKDAETFSFVEHQVVTTRNVRVPRIVDLVFGGLNIRSSTTSCPLALPFASENCARWSSLS